MKRLLASLALLICVVTSGAARAADVTSAEMKMAVTTSFHNSGLAEILLPEIAKDLGIEVHLLVVGTGQALKLGRAGDVDAILVHSRKAEDAFIAEGSGPHRREIMYNDFIFVGPESDPAELKSAADAVQLLKKVAAEKALFVSRGDDSGTHKKEKSLWAAAELDPATFDSGWYRAVGTGMGATLNSANGMQAYAMTDRATWLNFKNKKGMALIFEGDARLNNQYAYLPVSKEKHPHVKYDLAMKLEGWLASAKGQKLIGDYKIQGQQLFFPNAK